MQCNATGNFHRLGPEWFSCQYKSYVVWIIGNLLCIKSGERHVHPIKLGVGQGRHDKLPSSYLYSHVRCYWHAGMQSHDCTGLVAGGAEIDLAVCEVLSKPQGNHSQSGGWVLQAQSGDNAGFVQPAQGLFTVFSTHELEGAVVFEGKGVRVSCAEVKCKAVQQGTLCQQHLFLQPYCSLMARTSTN